MPGEVNVLEAVLGWTEGEAGRFAAALDHLGKAPLEFAMTRFYEAQVREKAGDAARAAQLHAELASSTEDDFFHALVRARAAARASLILEPRGPEAPHRASDPPSHRSLAAPASVP